MLRLVAYSVAMLGAAIGMAQAVPARPLYEPTDPPRSLARPAELHNTAWVGTESADRNLFFHSDGTLGYTRTQKAFGTWKLEGNNLYFEFNNRYREFRGTIQGNVIQGESWNRVGKRWQTRLQPAAIPPLGAVP